MISLETLTSGQMWLLRRTVTVRTRELGSRVGPVVGKSTRLSHLLTITDQKTDALMFLMVLTKFVGLPDDPDALKHDPLYCALKHERIQTFFG